MTDLSQTVLPFWPALWRLVVMALAVMGSPGPATLSVTAAAAAYGAVGGLRYCAGVVLGTVLVLCAIALGLGALLTANAQVAWYLSLAGLVYILFLAVRIALAPPLSAAATPLLPRFTGGIFLAVSNPKAWIAIAAVFAGNPLPLAPPLAEALSKTAILALLIVVIHLVWLLAGAALAKLFRHPVAARMINIVFAVTLFASALLSLA